jgi:hypothetical protein
MGCTIKRPKQLIELRCENCIYYDPIAHYSAGTQLFLCNRHPIGTATTFTDFCGDGVWIIDDQIMLYIQAFEYITLNNKDCKEIK